MAIITYMASLWRILKVRTKSIPLSLNDEVLEPGMLFAILIFNDSRKAHGCGPETKFTRGTKRFPWVWTHTPDLKSRKQKFRGPSPKASEVMHGRRTGFRIKLCYFLAARSEFSIYLVTGDNNNICLQKVVVKIKHMLCQRSIKCWLFLSKFM